MASTQELIKTAVERFQADVPALANLKLVFELELKGRGDVQMFRVAVPGPEISKEVADDAKLTVSIARSHFNELAADGRLEHWVQAYEHGDVKVTGDRAVIALLGNVIQRRRSRV